MILIAYVRNDTIITSNVISHGCVTPTIDNNNDSNDDDDGDDDDDNNNDDDTVYENEQE